MPVFDVCRKKLLMNIFKLDFSASKYCSIFMFNTVLDLKQSVYLILLGYQYRFCDDIFWFSNNFIYFNFYNVRDLFIATLVLKIFKQLWFQLLEEVTYIPAIVYWIGNYSYLI